MKKHQVGISTGIGRLHLVSSAAAVAPHVEVSLITGFAPRTDGTTARMLKLTNAGSKLVSRLSPRRPVSLGDCPIYQCTAPEVALSLCSPLSRRCGYAVNERTKRVCWQWFGWNSRRYIKELDVLHVRAGAGQGGLINAAKRQNTKILVDYSIAHPKFADQIAAELGGRDISFSINSRSPFWQLVEEDAQQADLILVNSDFVRETLVDAGFADEKIRTAHLGITETFRGLKTDYAISGPLKLLFTGTFGLRKGADTLVQTIRLLSKQGIDVKLTALGVVSPDVRRMIHEAELPLYHFPGFVSKDELRRHLSQSDMYVFPSNLEGCAQSLKEAMAAGLPVVTTRESGGPVTDSQTGIVCQRNKPRQFADRIAKLLESEDDRKRMGSAASDLIAQEHTWDEYGRSVAHIYEELIHRDA